MISKLNLSSQPFRNRTLPWMVATVVVIVSLLVIVYDIAESGRIRAEADVIERQVVGLRQQKAELEEQAKRITEEIPFEQRETLKAAHDIADRKTFSWSRLFSDLEASLPSSVRVARINVREVSQKGEQTTAELDLSVVGRTPTDVTGMIAEMGRGGFFSAVPLTETMKSGKGEAGYEWTLRVSYVQPRRTTSESEESDRTNVAASAGLETPNDGGRQ